MATELKTDSWHRYMLYRNDERYMTFRPDAERRKAADAGKKFTASAYADVWAKDSGLVQRVRQFLGENFHWHDRLAKSGSDLEVVQTLQDMVRGGSIVVIPEEPRRSGGSVGVSAPARKKTFHEQVMEKMGLSAGAAWDYIDWYNSTVQRLDDSEAARKAARRAKTLASADDADGETSTPLSDASPFEYQSHSIGGDVDSIAARGVSEAQEAECFSRYEFDLDQCNFGRAMFQSPAYYTECKARAFANYQQCRGY